MFISYSFQSSSCRYISALEIAFHNWAKRFKKTTSFVHRLQARASTRVFEKLKFGTNKELVFSATESRCASSVCPWSQQTKMVFQLCVESEKAFEGKDFHLFVCLLPMSWKPCWNSDSQGSLLALHDDDMSTRVRYASTVPLQVFEHHYDRNYGHNYSYYGCVWRYPYQGKYTRCSLFLLVAIQSVTLKLYPLSFLASCVVLLWWKQLAFSSCI